MDNNKIFIGNVNFNTAIETLVELASQFGEVVDSYKPQGKGFAFITFKSEEQAAAAIEGLNGKEVDGRELNVSIARPKEDRPRRDFGGPRRDFRGGDRGFRRD